MLDKLTPAQRKLINWLAFVIVIGVGLMLLQPPSYPSVAPDSDPVTQVDVPAVGTNEWNDGRSYEERIERELAQAISELQGVGTVKVFATLERGPKIRIAEDVTTENRQTEETLSDGGVRTTVEERVSTTPITLRNDGEQQETPLILEEYDPIIRGILVVADGAHDPDIRYRIARAVQTVLQIPMYKVEVLAKAN